MDPIELKAADLTARFLPGEGMTLASYKKGNIEVIDQGQGFLTGPGFPELRKAAWKATIGENSFTAELSSKETPLSQTAGQNFKLYFKAWLRPHGLKIDFAVVSDTDSVVGLDYHYFLPDGQGKILSKVQNSVIFKGEKMPFPKEWFLDNQHQASIELKEDIDLSMYTYPDPLSGVIVLETETHQLITRTHSLSQENCWRLKYEKGSPFVFISPLSAQDPFHPNLTVSSIEAELEIIPNKY